MRISIAQINSTIGDFTKNLEKIVNLSNEACQKDKADMILFPELAICGYPPMDLLDQDTFVEQNIRSLRILQRELPQNIAVGVGYVNRNASVQGKALVNAYGIISGGALVFEQIKTLLPTYDVFDEARNFEPASHWPRFDYKGQRIGFAICEDVWRETETPGTKYAEDPVRRLLDAGITMLVAPSASPYYTFKHRDRLNLARDISRRGDIPLIYINAVGANDSIIFDGRSFFMDAKQQTLTARAFEEQLLTYDTTDKSIIANQVEAPSLYADELDTLEAALVMGIREYMSKCGFKRAHLGLSGGIDSALVAYLAVQAIGSANVVTISMPSRFSSQGSKDDAAELAKNLGCRYEILPIESVFTAFLGTLQGVFEGRAFDVAEENLQARIRGSLLMAFSNKWSSMLLTTGNKSELAMGYCTLYGDMNGALGAIGDLFKTEVFALCRRINEKSIQKTGKPVIPPAIIEKPPSAELRPNQKDQDSLPPYDMLDAILSLYLFENLNADEIYDRGYDRDLASSIIKTVARAEFKRRQAPPVLKVSPRAFGMGRRMPIARCIYEM
ncbi:NAD+ synthase [Spirochaetia bacterium]|nr:NAD+ synthase [Spirochaetia bacterium]